MKVKWAVLCLLTSLSLFSCQVQSAELNDPLWLYYYGPDREIGIYELTPGVGQPELIFGDLPVSVLTGTDYNPHPTISPDGSLGYFPGSDGDFIVNFVSRQVLSLPANLLDMPDYYAAFSPSNHYLAFIQKGMNGLVVLDLANWDLSADSRQEFLDNWNILVPNRCFSYECGQVCASMKYPFWIDDQTLLFFHSEALFSRSGFPTVIPSCSEPMGYLDHLTVVSLEGETTTVSTESQRFDSWLMTMPFGNHEGNVLVTLPLDVMTASKSSPIVWWDIQELCQGVLDPHLLEDTDPNLFSLSPDENRLLRFNKGWEIVNIKTGEIEKISKQPTKVKKLISCDWNLDTGQIACSAWNESDQSTIFVFDEASKSSAELLNWTRDPSFSNYGWFLIGFAP